MPARKGIICLEGPWSRDLRSPDSVRSMVQFLAENGPYELIYRQVASAADLRLLLRTLRRSAYHRFRVLYFAFHGDPGVIKFGSYDMPLRAVAAAMGGSWRGRDVIFGTCETLQATPATLRTFMKSTRARSISGYVKEPDFIEATALDLLVMRLLLRGLSPSRVRAELMRVCPGLVADYGFQIHNARGA
ncbi:MAG: hypothetical protein FJY54_05675 [Betaproteobacteria bacterium]|nr:hypothetical protein [Betaproteobacteria bacterium]